MNAKDAKRASQAKKTNEANGTAADRTVTSSEEEATPASHQGQVGTDATPAVARAEELMDRAGERVGRFLLTSSQQLQRTMALAREAAEDLWVEAESIRRGERSNPD